MPLGTLDHALAHLATFLTVVRLLKRMPFYVRHRQTHIVPPELLECPDEALLRLFSPRRPADEELQQPAARSLLNLVFLAWSELVAAREVISLDPSHRHSAPADFRAHKNAAAIHSHIFSRRAPLARASVQPGLVPLFLAATPARSQLSRISKIILHAGNTDKNGRNRIGELIDGVARKPDWTVPFKLWFDYCFNKL